MKRVAGLDVHKDTIFACVKKGKYQSGVKEFGTTTSELEELFHWLQGERVAKVAMESTSTGSVQKTVSLEIFSPSDTNIIYLHSYLKHLKGNF
ncbi:MAG: hypothetical protein ACQERC_11450, partial [Bacteroidota bacterium]